MDWVSITSMNLKGTIFESLRLGDDVNRNLFPLCHCFLRICSMKSYDRSIDQYWQSHTFRFLMMLTNGRIFSAFLTLYLIYA